MLAFRICFGLIRVADGLVPWFFGDGYGPVVTLLKMFSPIIIIIGISNCLGSLYYNPVGKRAMSAKFIICGAVSNLIFNSIFIPKMGAMGAALGSLFAETIIVILYVVFSNGYAKVELILRLSWKRAVAAGLMFVSILPFYKIMSTSIKLTVVQVIVGACVYGIVLILLRDKYLIRFLKDIKGKLTKGLNK